MKVVSPRPATVKSSSRLRATDRCLVARAPVRPIQDRMGPANLLLLAIGRTGALAAVARKRLLIFLDTKNAVS